MTPYLRASKAFSRTRLRTKLILSYGLIIAISVAVFALTEHAVSPLSLNPPDSLPTAAAVANYTARIDHGLVKGLFLGIIFSLGFSVVVAALITRVVAHPLEQVRAAARHMTNGHYDTRVPVPASPDLAGIATDLNVLAARLDDTDRRRSRLVSDLAHELRTPLTILRGRLDGLIDGIFQPSTDIFTSMREEVARLERLTTDLSQLSRAEEEAYELHREPVELNALAGTVVEALRQRYDEQGVVLALTPGAPVIVNLDADRISQVIVNLLSNALTATDAGGRVTVTVTQDRAGATLRVTDTGHGIAPENLEIIFERFERLTPAGRPEPYSGSGVGLTIARAIARAHGGDLSAQSGGVGLGAVFSLVVPNDAATPGGSTTAGTQG